MAGLASLAKNDLTAQRMGEALCRLDAVIAENELLMSVAPIRLMSVGGSVAVRVLHNRSTTEDVDCLLDPNVAAVSEYWKEFEGAVGEVAARCNYTRDWLNQEINLFIAKEKRLQLFLESVDQAIMVYEGANLVVYAAKVEWALERKVRRVSQGLGSSKFRESDVMDAAALVKHMRDRGGRLPLTASYIRELNFNGFEVPASLEGIRAVARFYEDKYGEVGIELD